MSDPVSYQKRITELEAEVGRLREALERIIDHVGVGAADIIVANTMLGRVKQEVRTALSQPPQGVTPPKPFMHRETAEALGLQSEQYHEPLIEPPQEERPRQWGYGSQPPREES